MRPLFGFVAAWVFTVSQLSADPAVNRAPPAHATESVAPAPPVLERGRYPWLVDTAAMPAAVEPLEARFAAPSGFERVAVAKGSFGAWLRGLPLAAAGTGVVSFRGDPVLAADDDRLAAVVAIDTGSSDLMQCADSVIRMHAEWRWSTGARDQSYRALSGTALPFSRYLGGERPKYDGHRLAWVAQKPMRDDHPSFRRYLDDVFAWANTVSLAAQAKPVARADLAPGDFVVMPGGPGHAVLVLDVARGANGRVALLLGQGYMPAQGFYVVRPSRKSAWFVVVPEDYALATPFWQPFPWSSLRRLS